MKEEHNLKTRSEYFKEVYEGNKNFELRKNDRNYKVWDILNLHDYCPIKKEYSGFSVKKEIAYILQGGSFGLEEGYVILSLKPTR